MSSPEYNKSAAPEILQLNMEIISKELTDLIVTCEQEYGMTQQFQMGCVKTTAQSFVNMGAPAVPNNFQIPTYITNAYYRQRQQIFATNGLPNIKHNLNYCGTFQQPVAFNSVNSTANNVIGAPNTSMPPNNYVPAGVYLNNSCFSSTQSPYSNSTGGSPAFEFHYLRSHGDAKKFPPSMCSSGVIGSYRKISKLPQKHFNQKMQNTRASSEEIKFDLSALDLLNHNKENSIVQQLFDLLRDLHCAVAETPPSFESNCDSQYEETFAPCVSRKSSMPSTLNVQNQVKQACRKLTIFTYEMQRILSANKMFDAKLHAECEFYLNQLRQYLNQLEIFKRFAMEHKHGQFLREDVKVNAERLSILLEHTNRQIREVHIRILAVDWYIGVKYRGDVHTAAMQLNVDKNKEVTYKSKIGVINEILQMGNTTTATSSPIKATTTDATITHIETTKPEVDTTNNISLQLFNNQEVVKAKPLLNENCNDIFHAYKPDQTKRATNVNSSGHTRQPVFYIG